MPLLDNTAIIRRATESDIAPLTSLLSLLFTQEADFTPNTACQQDGLRQIIRSPTAGIIFVAQGRTGGVLGMVSLLFTISTATGGRAAWLEDMIVAPEARQCGIGSQLIRHAIAWSQSNGVTRLTLLTDENNFAAQRFYLRHGFTSSAMTVLRLPLAADQTDSVQGHD